MPHNQYTTICDNFGHQVGRVKNGVFRKTIRATHLLRCPPAIAYGVEVIAAAKAAGAERLEVANLDTGRTYRASLAHFEAHALPIDRGHGKQLALPLEAWTLEDRRPQARQLALFAEVGR